MTSHQSFDYIVVGSGFGGSVAALRLVEKGYRVLVIEEGKRYQPQDFATSNWNLRRFIWLPQLWLQGIMRISLFKHVMVLSGSGVGGGSLVYANTLLNPADATWKDPDWPQSIDWRNNLAPCYAKVEKMLGVTRNPYLGAADKALQHAAQTLGVGDSFYHTNVAVFFGEPGKSAADPYFKGEGPDRIGCTLHGACMVGCRDGGKNTLDKNYLYFAEKKGALIMSQTRVIDVHPSKQDDDNDGYIVTTRSSTNLFSRQKQQIKTKGIVIAAGVLGTLKLLLDCKERGSLPLLSDQLGRHVHTNSESLIGVRKFGKDVNFSDGIAIGSGIYIDQHTHIEAVRYPNGSDLLGLLSMPMTEGDTQWQRFTNFLKLFVTHPWRTLRLLNPFGMARTSIILLVMQTIKGEIEMKLKRSLMMPWKKILKTEGKQCLGRRVKKSGFMLVVKEVNNMRVGDGCELVNHG